MISAQEAKLDLERAGESLKQKLQRVERWLSDDRLHPWHQKLRQLFGQEHEQVPSFYSLLAGTKGSFKSALNAMNVPFLCALYSKGSMAIHGGSISTFFVTSDREIVPKFVDPDAEIERACSGVAEMCNIIVMDLWVMRDDVLASGT